MHDEKKEGRLPHFELTRTILGCCFDVMKELGPGFQERVYKNALLIAMKQEGLHVEYLKVSGLPIGLLINFRRRKLDYQRLHQSEVFKSGEEGVEEPIPF